MIAPLSMNAKDRAALVMSGREAFLKACLKRIARSVRPLALAVTIWSSLSASCIVALVNNRKAPNEKIVRVSAGRKRYSRRTGIWAHHVGYPETSQTDG